MALADRSITPAPILRAHTVAQLAVIEGRPAGQKFKLDAQVTIGRSPDAAVMLDDPEVSRLHARISRAEGGGFLVEDLGSKNGTFVNGVRIDRRVLVYGDRIRIGPQVVLELSSFDAIEDHIVQRQRFEAIGRLGVGIAHDLNNVLAALQAGAAFLRGLPAERSLSDREVRECISDLTLAAARASELTRGILSFARGHGAARGPVDLSALVREVVRMLRHTLDQSIRIEPDIASDVFVHGSHSELHQVLLNLCLNARDAMTGGGVLRIGTKLEAWPGAPLNEEARPAAVLFVQDTGIGMDPELVSRVFEPFFTTKREGAGYGLGLATVREIVTLHGGHVTIESSPGRGSAFKILLPMVDPESGRLQATGERPATALLPRSSGPVSVLLVDDEQIVRRSVARLLRQAGFEVTEACDGSEALARYARRAYDLVLLDLDMPGLNGEQVQTRLMSLDPHARIVFASGHADPQREAQVRTRGALAFLQKPFGLDTLLTLVNEVLADDVDGIEEPTRPK